MQKFSVQRNLRKRLRRISNTTYIRYTLNNERGRSIGNGIGVHLNGLRPVDKSLETIGLICISDGVFQYSASALYTVKGWMKGEEDTKSGMSILEIGYISKQPKYRHWLNVYDGVS